MNYNWMLKFCGETRYKDQTQLYGRVGESVMEHGRAFCQEG